MFRPLPLFLPPDYTGGPNDTLDRPIMAVEVRDSFTRVNL